MSTPNEIFDPYAGQYPPPKAASTTSKPSNGPFYLVDPYNSTTSDYPGSFQTYNNSRSSHTYSDPRSSQTFYDSRSSRRHSDPRSSRRYSGSRSSQTQNNSRSSSLPLSDQSQRSESTIISSKNQFVSPENVKSDYHDPEAMSLREYLEAERQEKLRIQKEIEMELRYSQTPAKLEPVHYIHPIPNETNVTSKHGKNKKGTKRNQDLENEKYEYKKTYSLRSILGMVFLIFFLLVGVGLIVAERIILGQCDCDGCIECSTTFHQGLLYSGIGLLCITGIILVLKTLRRICCYKSMFFN
ncbi:hypothetical protein K501DRAFT_299747 [Backusella circina FSU 941]|nr:hypothetical protein K501DRAFT_299747 [Backusella circina FSU 941]